MPELIDYSGEMNPELKMEDFSKAALVRLWQAASKLYIGMDALWVNLVREKLGEKTAMEWDTEIWLRRGAAEAEVSRTREALNIWGDDVAAFLKYAQVDPGIAGVMEVECELKSKNLGILTVKRCRPLEWCERHGETEWQKNACEVLDAEGFPQSAHLFNPRIEVRPLKLPPRQSPDEIACQWEFRIEE